MSVHELSTTKQTVELKYYINLPEHIVKVKDKLSYVHRKDAFYPQGYIITTDTLEQQSNM